MTDEEVKELVRDYNAACDQQSKAVAGLLVELNQARGDVVKLQGIVNSLSDRVAVQAESLSKQAERSADIKPGDVVRLASGSHPWTVERIEGDTAFVVTPGPFCGIVRQSVSVCCLVKKPATP